MDNDVQEKLIYVCGIYYNVLLESPPHAWLETENNIIIDITGDQFQNYPEPLRFTEPIYIGPSNDFYKLFDIRERELCDNYYPLNDIQVRRHLSRKKLYEIILEYIK